MPAPSTLLREAESLFSSRLFQLHMIEHHLKDLRKQALQGLLKPMLGICTMPLSLYSISQSKPRGPESSWVGTTKLQGKRNKYGVGGGINQGHR